MYQDILQKIFDLVESRTGYIVSVSSNDDLQTTASMITASPSNPTHLICINPKFDRASTYLVALQCYMLLEKWADDGIVYHFVSKKHDIDYQIKKVIKKIKANIPDDIKENIAYKIVTGLLQQVNSFPCEMFATEICYNDHISLREEQSWIINQQLRMNATSLDPDIRKIMPPDIFKKNATMNAAYALWWSRLSNDSSVIVPYKVADYMGQGEELFTIIENNKNLNINRYQYTVDAWAEKLQFTDCYEWIKKKDNNATIKY